LSATQDDPREAAIWAAKQQLELGAHGQARVILLSVLTAAPMPRDLATFLMLRMLGQASRKLGDLAGAHDAYARSHELATTLGRPDLESASLEGLGLVEAAAERHEVAVELFDAAASLAAAGGDELGVAIVRMNQGISLVRLDRGEEAEAVFRGVLAYEHLPEASRAVVQDNLAQALLGLGRGEEAVELTTEAIRFFEKADMALDRYTALLNLELALRSVGRADEAVAAFEQAHDLIERLAVERLDGELYAGYRDRVAEIEAASAERVSGDEELPAWLAIGINATVATNLADEAELQVEAGKLEKAEQSLLLALAHWEEIGAWHALPRVHLVLATLYTNAGQADDAVFHLMAARNKAHEVGDAFREQMASINLAMAVLTLAEAKVGVDPLQLLAHGRALMPYALQQLGASMDDDGTAVVSSSEVQLDGGVIDSLDSTICFRRGASALAERLVRRSLATLDDRVDGDEAGILTYRLAERLMKLYRFLYAQGRATEADEVAARAEGLVKPDGHPRISLSVNGSIGRDRFDRGEWTIATFQQLLAACDAHERLRHEALPIGDLAVFNRLGGAPYTEAVEIAIDLGFLEEALHLLERSKARSLLDVLRAEPRAPNATGIRAEEMTLWRQLSEARAEFDRIDPGEAPIDRARRLYRAQERIEQLQPELEQRWEQLDAEDPGIAAYRLAQPATPKQLAEALAARGDDALLVELFVGERTVQALTLERSGAVGAHRLIDTDDDQWQELVELFHKDGHRTGAVALATLTHPALRKLSDTIDEITQDHTVFLVPHQFLHSLPLHLVGAGAELRPRPRTFHLPSASLLHYRAGGNAAGDGALVAGDPLADLPFAALEAASVAASVGVQSVTGAACSREWLSEQLGSEPRRRRLIHLACHALFNPRRPERSGLVVADGDAPAVLPTSWLSALDWTADLVVLSACSSGQQEVRGGDELVGLTRTLLARGARALIVALWEVPDLATYLLIDRLYESLPDDGRWSPEMVADALAMAQQVVRSLTARYLIEMALELRDEAEATGELGRLRCAMGAVAAAHRAAGNWPEWMRWQQAIKGLATGEVLPPDIGTADWSVQEALSRVPAYDVAPFEAPIFWAAFVVAGCG
jgi:CHAT domain-containing protein